VPLNVSFNFICYSQNQEIEFETGNGDCFFNVSVENPNAIKAELFPNPSNGIFNVVLSQTSGNLAINIYNHLGQIISSKQERRNSFQIEINEASGLYVIELVNEEGQRQTTKVVKK